MPTDKQPVTIDQISEIILECLQEGRRVEIDGIGVFRNSNAGCSITYYPFNRRILAHPC